MSPEEILHQLLCNHTDLSYVMVLSQVDVRLFPGRHVIYTQLRQVMSALRLYLSGLHQRGVTAYIQQVHGYLSGCCTVLGLC